MKLSSACATLFLLYHLETVQSLAVMSVDLGSEWMKVAFVSPGIPMEIALNKESKRKTPAIISFRDNVRLIGDDAQTVGIRFPKNAYSYVLDLLGKGIDHPLVKLYQQRFPYYEIVENPERKTILFKHDAETFYSPEELVAQFLTKAKEMAETSAHQPIKECVLTVPGYFNQIERKSLLKAAELAGLKVLQLINDYTAVAMNYGIFRSKTFNETAQYVMFYDMGASSTTATLVSYQSVKVKSETHPQVSILGVGYDRTLGGLEMQSRLQHYLAKKFNELKKTKNDVLKNPRAMAKLFKEAGRLKNVLSANAEHYAQVEGLLDEQDFKVLVTRQEFEELIPDLLERVAKPVEQALKAAELSIDVVDHVVLVGAGTRVPKVQEKLQEAVQKVLSKNLNTDEAAAMGAVYKAADLSTGFQVKKFITKDAVVFPIQIAFERDNNGSIKLVKRTLFALMNPYPQKKIITFHKNSDDFSFNVFYDDLTSYLPENEITNIGATNLSQIRLYNIAGAIARHTGKNLEGKGIKAHFNLDESGILSLLNVEYVVEKTNLDADEDEGTLSKLGSTFSKLFGGDDEKPVEEKEAEPTEEKPVVPETNKTEAKNATVKETKPKITVIKEPLKAIETILTVDTLTPQEFVASLAKLSKLDKIESDINRRANALNVLESFVNDVRNKLYEDEFANAATEEEIEKIRSACEVVSDWLYEDGAEADAETYEKKLEELQDMAMDLFLRVREHRERPEALAALTSMLNHSSNFLANAKNLTKTTNKERDVFTDTEVEALEKLIKETTDWREKLEAEQVKLKNFEVVKLTLKSINDKMLALDREVKYLVNKMKLWRPKKVEKPVVEKEAKENETVPVEEEVKENADVEVEENVEPSKTEDQEDANHTEL